MAYTHLITPRQLQAALATPTPPFVFDCSFNLALPEEGRQQYLQSHVSGAVHADLETHLSAHAGDEQRAGGRHPLPTRERFAVWLRAVGFSNGMQAVVYDRNGTNFCGRLWWMLKWAGHENVAILDGGLGAWQREGGEEASGVELVRQQGSFALQPALRALVDASEVEEALNDETISIVDARARQRYLGIVEPLDRFAGHIPGAKNRPFSENFREDGTFKSPSDLRREFVEVLGSTDPQVIHQCGSGVSAIPNLVAMELAGFAFGRLYAGSWSDWCSAPYRPRVSKVD